MVVPCNANATKRKETSHNDEEENKANQKSSTKIRKLYVQKANHLRGYIFCSLMETKPAASNPQMYYLHS